MNNYLITKTKSLKESRFLKIWLIFLVISLTFSVVRYSEYSLLENFFGDIGAAFKANKLISDGYLPAIDFSYLYGLLPLALGKVWFSVFGNNLQAFFITASISYIFSSAALARIVISANLGLLGIIFIAVSIPFFTFAFPYLNFTYALEPIFILWAVAEHTEGRRGNALIFLVFGYFTKPSMAFMYAAVILALYINDLIRGKISINQISREILPAALALIFILTSLTIIFGFSSLVASILSPIQGSAHYKAMNYGLLGTGKKFLYYPGVRLGYYIGSAGFWLTSTVTLFVSGLYFLYKIFILKQNTYKNFVTETLLAISILYLIFIFCFFAGFWSWMNYSYLLTVGIALLDSKELKMTNNYVRNFLIFLIMFQSVGFYIKVSDSYKSWVRLTSSSTTLGLYSTPKLRTEFSEVLGYCQIKKVFILGASIGGVDVFFPECKSPDAWWLLKGVYNKKEIERINYQISQSEIIILPKPYGNPDNIDLINYQDQLTKFQQFKQGEFFDFLKRS